MLRLSTQSNSLIHSRILFGTCLYKNIGLKQQNGYSTATDPDFLHKSRLPTDFFQKSLPRLPIPKLEDTCSRYLKTQLPVLSPEDYANTEKLVNEFKEGEGKVLNDELIQRDKQNKHTNYVSGPWFDMYLRDRRAVCLNHNPFMSFKNDPKPGYNDQLVRATNFLVSSARFMKTLRANVLEPEVFHLNPNKSDTQAFRRVMSLFPQSIAFYGAAVLYKAYALDISQYSRLFNSTRIPRPGKDELHGDPSANHVLVLRRGHFYTFDLLNKEGRILPAEEIMSHVKHIMSDTSAPAESPVAVLTSQDRDTWTKLREQLVAAGNEATLKQIDNATFVLSLDEDELSDDDPAAVSRSFLHGDGSNRWFDKSFSLLMAGDGKSAVNMEHAWGDGVAVLRYFNDVFKDTTENPCVHPDTQPASVDSSSAVTKLEFKLTDSLKQGIKDCMANFQNTVNGLAMDFVKHEEHTRKDLKQLKLSPDSFMQLAIQMGYYKQFGHTPATYESCSTAAFRHGRTETIRSATTATKKACELFERSSGTLPSVSELQEAIRECSKVHGELTKNAAMGQGFDRHLFGLKNLAAEKGGPLPAIYQDPAYAKINHIILSTSTLTSPALLLGGFAPVVPDGFGVGYGVDDNYLGCNVTVYPGAPPHRDVGQFVRSVEASLIQMINVMQGKPPK